MRNNFRFDLDGTGSVSYFTIDTGLPVWVGFSTREGGVSSPPYAAANMAYHVGDDSPEGGGKSPLVVSISNRACRCSCLYRLPGSWQSLPVSGPQKHADGGS